MTAKQSSREEMTGWLDDSEIDPEMICALLSLLVSPCLSLSLLVSPCLLLSPWFFIGARVTRCRTSSKLQGCHLNFRFDTLEIENLLTAGIAMMQCIVCSTFVPGAYSGESWHCLQGLHRSHAEGIQRSKTAFGIRLCALNC